MNYNPVKKLMQQAWLLLMVAAVPLPALSQAQVEAEVPGTDVSFKTDDGWTIHATYYVPRGAIQGPVPGVVLLSEPDWVPRSILDYISDGIISNGMAALTIDVRGTDASIGTKDYQLFTQQEIDSVQLDIRAAIKYLSSQKEVDKNRIAIFGAGSTVDYVAREAAINTSQVKALILTTGWLSDEGRKSIKFRKYFPMLVVASQDTPKQSQALASEPYYLSENTGSRLIFVMDRGASFFNRPGQPDQKVVDWLKDNLFSLGSEIEVAIKSEDGATLQGTLYKPHGLQQNQKVGGVVFVHGANHDASTWYHLAQEVTKTGLAALIFDQRGFRKSIVKDESERDVNITGDIKAAVNYLASQGWVDPDRLAIITATSRGGPTIVAAHGDARIKTIVGLSFYGMDDDPNSRSYLSNMDIPLFLVASTTDIRGDGRSLADATREAYSLSNNKETELLMYDDAGRGSSMLKTKPELVGMIVRWFNDKLTK